MSVHYLVLIPFFALLGVLLYAEHVENMKLRYLCMITLMPLLIVYYILGALPLLNILILIGLIFGYLGDIFLMFNKENLFILGLGAFLIGHIFYIIAFLLSIDNVMNFPVWGLLFIIPSVIIILVVLKRTLKEMGELRTPTLVYVSVIFLMGVCSILRLASFGGIGFLFVWLGAQLFMASDAMLAIKKFDSGFAYDEVFIKLTYVLAQFFIAQGMLMSI